MATGTTNYTMIDINYVPGNKVRGESFRIVLSRGGVNGTTDRGEVLMDTEAFHAFLGRAKALIGRSSNL